MAVVSKGAISLLPGPWRPSRVALIALIHARPPRDSTKPDACTGVPRTAPRPSLAGLPLPLSLRRRRAAAKLDARRWTPDAPTHWVWRHRHRLGLLDPSGRPGLYRRFREALHGPLHRRRLPRRHWPGSESRRLGRLVRWRGRCLGAVCGTVVARQVEAREGRHAQLPTDTSSLASSEAYAWERETTHSSRARASICRCATHPLATSRNPCPTILLRSL